MQPETVGVGGALLAAFGLTCLGMLCRARAKIRRLEEHLKDLVKADKDAVTR